MASHFLPLDVPPEALLERILHVRADLGSDSTDPVILHIAGGGFLRPAHALHLADLVRRGASSQRDVIGDAIAPIQGVGVLVWLACPLRTFYPSGYIHVDPSALSSEAVLRSAWNIDDEPIESRQAAGVLIDYRACLARIVELAETTAILGHRLDAEDLVDLGLLPPIEFGAFAPDLGESNDLSRGSLEGEL